MSTFYLPDLGEGLAEAEIREWLVKEGDTVKVDQPLVSMETAKAVVEVPSPQAGKIVKLHGKNGEIIPTGSALVEFDGAETRQDKGTVVGNLEESSAVLDEGDMIIGAAKSQTSTVKAMPAVRNLAKQLNVDLNLVKATGPNGQITADDVKKLAGEIKSSEKKSSSQVETLHGVRRSMAVAMTHSHQEVVPVTIVDDADITNFSDDLTVKIMQAMITALKEQPSLNAWYEGKTMERCIHQDINIGLAMDTDEGLFVPVIKQAQQKSPQELRQLIDNFKKTVRDRSVPPSELQGATITLSNFGMFAGRYATPIVVPPQVAILGVGKLREEAKPHQGKIEIRKLLPLSLTFDHRAVTGGEATRFLGSVIKQLESK
jgi:2-oxoisovalerate dehydrogenase E2 component (dihydrolipoyl transacylase)